LKQPVGSLVIQRIPVSISSLSRKKVLMYSSSSFPAEDCIIDLGGALSVMIADG
jgi:hypothetical protein